MTSSLILPALFGLIGIALAFDFLNGAHDTANSIATIVSTRMLRPRYAVIWAASFNFIAFLLLGVHVARTIGVGIVSAEVGGHAAGCRRGGRFVLRARWAHPMSKEPPPNLQYAALPYRRRADGTFAVMLSRPAKQGAGWFPKVGRYRA